MRSTPLQRPLLKTGNDKDKGKPPFITFKKMIKILLPFHKKTYFDSYAILKLNKNRTFNKNGTTKINVLLLLIIFA